MNRINTSEGKNLQHIPTRSFFFISFMEDVKQICTLTNFYSSASLASLMTARKSQLEISLICYFFKINHAHLIFSSIQFGKGSHSIEPRAWLTSFYIHSGKPIILLKIEDRDVMNSICKLIQLPHESI